MSYFYRERPRFGERFRGKSGDELLEELKQEFGEDSPFFDSTRTNGASPNAANRTRDPFERHATFPRGFPFDDDGAGGGGGFGRRSDIRAHLDDLAARHPEFADHLLGPPWADVPFPGANAGGSLPRSARNRRGSQQQQQPPTPQSNGYHHQQQHNHPDEDARSQASSGGSAASGASAVSSHGSEPDNQHHQESADTRLRDHANMENPPQPPLQQQRNVRSMSAPPENRNNPLDNNPRFVSRVDINPQAQSNQTQPQPGVHQNQVPPQQSQREKSPAPQQGQKAQSNVRQIPIFVEGRDKPVIARERDEPDFSTRRQQSPPHFQRPSHFQQQYNRQPSGWGSNFQDPFFEHTGGRWNHPQPQPQSTFPEFRHTQQEKPRQTHNSEFWHPNQQQHKPHTQPQPQSQPKKQPEPQPEAPPKPKQQVQPKDPLEKVAMVQKEVDALTEQVKQFTGNSRQDKQYMYLDEMLTRELIKLDDIDTEGKENVRQARKQAIKSIQESISLLESKAPVPGQQPKSDEKTEEELVEVKEGDKMVESNEKPVEPMETNEEPVPEEQKAIPLPPPLSPSKANEVPEAKAEVNSPSNETTQPKESNIQPQEQVPVAPQTDAPVQDAQQQQVQVTAEDTLKPQEQLIQNPEPMDSSTTVAPQVPNNDVEMEIRQPSPAKELPQNPEQPKENEENKKTEVATTETVKTKKEPPPVPAKPGKSPKKAKKTKKQPEPVSETAIPLPAPGQSI